MYRYRGWWHVLEEVDRTGRTFENQLSDCGGEEQSLGRQQRRQPLPRIASRGVVEPKAKVVVMVVLVAGLGRADQVRRERDEGWMMKRLK